MHEALAHGTATSAARPVAYATSVTALLAAQRDRSPPPDLNELSPPTDRWSVPWRCVWIQTIRSVRCGSRPLRTAPCRPAVQLQRRSWLAVRRKPPMRARHQCQAHGLLQSACSSQPSPLARITDSALQQRCLRSAPGMCAMRRMLLRKGQKGARHMFYMLTLLRS